jgi:hypothetical protein
MFAAGLFGFSGETNVFGNATEDFYDASSKLDGALLIDWQRTVKA